MSEEQQESSAVTPKKREQGQNLTSAEKNALQSVFLETFAVDGNIMLACKAAGISRTTLYRWKEKPQFLKQYEAALDDAKDNIKAEVYRRGHDGVDEPLTSLGRPVYDDDGKLVMVKKYSDSLLMFHAKMLMPEYRDRQQVDLNANVNAQVQASHDVTISPRDLTDEELATMKTLAKNAMERKKQKGEQ